MTTREYADYRVEFPSRRHGNEVNLTAVVRAPDEQTAIVRAHSKLVTKYGLFPRLGEPRCERYGAAS